MIKAKMKQAVIPKMFSEAGRSAAEINERAAKMTPEDRSPGRF